MRVKTECRRSRRFSQTALEDVPPAGAVPLGVGRQRPKSARDRLERINRDSLAELPDPQTEQSNIGADIEHDVAVPNSHAMSKIAGHFIVNDPDFIGPHAKNPGSIRQGGFAKRFGHSRSLTAAALALIVA